MVLHDALEFTNVAGTERQLAVVFDNNRDHEQAIRAKAAVYETGANLGLTARYGLNQLVSTTFADSKRFCPLQAADMLAGETYRLAQLWLATGGQPQARPHFQRFLDNGLLVGGIASRESISKIIEISRFVAWRIALLLEADQASRGDEEQSS